MATQEPNPEAGKRQAEKPENLDKSPPKALATGVREKAKSGDREERAVADAVRDLEGND